jgi:hypothetical protein
VALKLRLAALVSMFTLLGGSPAVGHAEPLPTNYELVQSATRVACAKLVEGMRSHLGTGAVSVRGVGTAAGQFLVENIFTSVLTEAGVKVTTRADSVSPRIEFEVVDLGLAYTGAHRSPPWIGHRSIDRTARARLFARVVDPVQARIVWADQAEGHRTDRVAQSALVRLEEEKPTAYEKPARPPGRWNKVVEPVVVTGIVVGLIALFFSNQSTK